MEVIRTPDERFTNLPDYPFAPHYAEIPDLEDALRGRGAARRGSRRLQPRQPHVILEGGSHFLQEDVPDAWLAHFLPWLEATR